MPMNILEVVLYKASFRLVLLIMLARTKWFKEVLQKKEYSKSDLNKIGIIFGILSMIGTYTTINVYGAISATRTLLVVSAILVFGRRSGIIALTISLIYRLSVDLYTISLEIEIAQFLLVSIMAIIFQPMIKEKNRPILGVIISEISVLIMIIYIILCESNNKEMLDYIHVFAWSAIISQLGVGLFINVLQGIRNENALVEQEKEIERLKTKIVKAELKALQAQINPHFLFNTLNAISILVRKNPDEARSVIFKLSHYLRYNLNLKTGLIDIHKEIEQTKTYLEIEEVRFKNKLEIIYDIDEKINAKIPSLIIQPIVENAIVHGILASNEKGKLIISVKQKDEIVNIVVENTGVPIDESVIRSINDGDAEENKIGLYNVHCRLKYQYGIGLKITRLDDGTRVEFKVRGE